ncbi:MAG: hypothetical protein ACSHWY_04960 [Octadecabacter sp.]
MNRFCLPVITVSLLGGCIAPQPATSANPTYICTATRSCTDAGCAPSDLEFNLSGQDPTETVISFVDSSFALDYVETTTAFLPDGPVSLTTFQDMNAADGMRLTLANDGTSSLRARLILTPVTAPRDISGICVPYADARP